MVGLSGFSRSDLWIFDLNATSWVELTQNITGDGVTARKSNYESSRGYALADGTLVLIGGSSGSFKAIDSSEFLEFLFSTLLMIECVV
jgi:hypothetical protein